MWILEVCMGYFLGACFQSPDIATFQTREQCLEERVYIEEKDSIEWAICKFKQKDR